MESLETGNHFNLFSSDLHNRPIGPKFGEDYRPVIVQPLGTEPEVWQLKHFGDSKYTIMFKELDVRIVRHGVELCFPRIPPLPPFLWKIIPENTAPPLPAPLYKIFVADAPQENWFIDKHSSLAEVPVRIFDEASPIVIRSVAN